MNSVNVHTHHRMGDHLICYGGIKEIAKKYDEVVVRTLDPYFENVTRLYSSIPNVKVIALRDNQWTNDGILFCCTDWWFSQVRDWYDPNTRSKPYTLGEGMIFDRFWYNIAGLSLSLKWDNFYLERNLDKEKTIFYDVLGLDDRESFVFLHEDPYNTDEDRTIKRKHIDNNLRVINMGEYPDISILDTTYLIERARDIHVINSAFLTFIDLMQIKNKNLNYHKYARSNPVEQVALRLNWHIIEQ